MQPDTITPGGPQGLNRYSYVTNNPINFNDPSGHLACEDEGNNSDTCKHNTLDNELHNYGVVLKGKKWKENRRDKVAALLAVRAVGDAMMVASGSHLSSYGAFRKAYNITSNDKLVLEMVHSYTYDGNEYPSGGVTINNHLIQLADLSSPGGNRTVSMAMISARNNIVHELGHSFASTWSIGMPGESLLNEDGWPDSPESANLTWRQHPSRWDNGNALAGEVYADMFLGWTFGVWGTGDTAIDREDFMSASMGNFWGNH